jgi:hypothetical protein
VTCGPGVEDCVVLWLVANNRSTSDGFNAVNDITICCITRSALSGGWFSVFAATHWVVPCCCGLMSFFGPLAVGAIVRLADPVPVCVAVASLILWYTLVAFAWFAWFACCCCWWDDWCCDCCSDCCRDRGNGWCIETGHHFGMLFAQERHFRCEGYDPCLRFRIRSTNGVCWNIRRRAVVVTRRAVVDTVSIKNPTTMELRDLGEQINHE